MVQGLFLALCTVLTWRVCCLLHAQVHIVVDAVSSQRSVDRAAGLHRAAQSGAFLVTSEMALFQLMQVRHTWVHGRVCSRLGGAACKLLLQVGWMRNACEHHLA